MSMGAVCACGCGQGLEPKDQYGRPRRFISGHNTRKYDDPQEHKRAWNRRNPEKRKAAKSRRHRALKVRLVAAFGSACKDCGLAYNGKNAAVFHFHHKIASSKSFALGNKLTAMSWERIISEAKKCVMLCACCHELRHSSLF